jgi:hypothetical protein
MRVMIHVRVLLVALVLAPLGLAGCGGDRADDGGEPEGRSRSLPANLCAWIPAEYLTGLVVNEPTNSEALGVPTSICTAVARKGAKKPRYVNVILKRFPSLDKAREDNVEACQTFAQLAPTTIEAPGVDAVQTCARRGDTSTYLITVPNESGDTLLVSIGGTPPAAALSASTEITNSIAAELSR